MILAQILLLAWLLVVLLPGRFRWLAVLLAGCVIIPWGNGVSLAMALRTLWGDPSVTSLQLIVLTLVGRVPVALTRGWRAPGVIAVIGLILYTLALGAGNFDPYRLGFQPALLVAVLVGPALALWWRGQSTWLWLLAIDLLAFAAHLLESTNFWDYAIDPLLVIACLVLALRNLFSRRRPSLE